ncbi:hypothetical protein SELMODRAFT_439783 [Selaginella moellendorffii]|uniref:Uncharacterized protein SmMTP1 n=1 Tax=Selaginella moellendorffii TaxID=88036 RepID=D8R787_SELML|nr:metal tolerance protein 1 [Selaginella moellendorffii]EFJ31844.1 hypothetical protein SELMODRAFT_439783 [Selaginella moellendorffii]|eukprot:XP_002967245.1 metal tolerance protein 1 [Selaginella moellendorffii]
MEREVQPLIHSRCGVENADDCSFLESCHNLEDLKKQPSPPAMEFTRKKRLVCSNVASCALSERSSSCDHEEEHCETKEKKRKRGSVSRRLWLAMAFCLALMVVEVIGGFMANSLAILADAAHLLSDVASFGVSIFAIWASGWKATARCSYGFHRLETLGALLSILIIWIVTGFLVYEAVFRLVHELAPIDGRLMFAIAAVGFFANLVMVFILGHGESHHHRHSDGHCHRSSLSGESYKQEGGSLESSDTTEKAHLGDLEKVVVIEEEEEESSTPHSNLNLRGAYLHILGDMIQSVGVLVGGAIIWRYPRLRYVDVVCTLVFSLVVLWTTLRLLRDVVEILMESSPRGIQAEAVQSGLELAHPDVLGVHELHIWSVTTGKVLLSCHVAVKHDADADLVLQRVVEYCYRELKTSHVTVQIERMDVDHV